MNKQRAFYINDSYLPFLEAKQRTQIFYGGSSSGKSFFLAQRAVKDNLEGTNYLITRGVGATLKHSVFNEVVKAIEALGVGSCYTINRTDLAITCGRNGKQILFAGLDNVEKLKSITPKNGVLETVWMEEATEVHFEDYKQLSKRLRGLTQKPKRLVLSFNPILKSHWIYREFFGGWDDGKTLLEEKDLLICKTTYRDNHFLTQGDRAALENESDRYFYEVYSLGNWGVLGKVIFGNWKTQDLTGMRQTAANCYCGLDFGFSEDPTAFIQVAVDRGQKKLYILDEFYRTGMFNDELAEVLLERIGGEYVTCDSASPGTIAELARYGVRAIPAVKGKDSILAGIQWLCQYEIIIDLHCQHFKNEIQAYHWQEDKYGNTLQRPADRDNHLMDALRYAVEPLQRENMLRGDGRRLF